mgnify:CR=1 FL=1
MDGSSRIRKLRWCCRRGMKELDMLLRAFLTEQADAIECGAWPELEALLETEDDILWGWLQKPFAATGRGFGPLLQQIRHARD